MKSLFLDTSNSNAVVSIIKDNTILSYVEFQNSKLLSENIFILIDKSFKKSNILPNDIDTIFVVNGPGSFTGVRIGVTIAKTMAWTLNKKVIPVSSLECFASTIDNGNVVSLIDARRNYVFAGIYDSDLNVIQNDKYIKIDELKLDNYKIVSLDDFDNIVTIKPKYNILKIIDKHKDDAGVLPHKLVPNYLKLTEAEEKRIKNDC